jgi:hypothetical protein
MFARQESLHAEEVGVEDGSENGLVHGDFRGDRADLGGEVEVAAQEEKPVILIVSNSNVHSS